MTLGAGLLKHIVRCYLRLSDNLRAREALRQCLPDSLKDATFAHSIKDDLTVKRWLSYLHDHTRPRRFFKTIVLELELPLFILARSHSLSLSLSRRRRPRLRARRSLLYNISEGAGDVGQMNG